MGAHFGELPKNALTGGLGGATRDRKLLARDRARRRQAMDRWGPDAARLDAGSPLEVPLRQVSASDAPRTYLAGHAPLAGRAAHRVIAMETIQIHPTDDEEEARARQEEQIKRLAELGPDQIRTMILAWLKGGTSTQEQAS